MKTLFKLTYIIGLTLISNLAWGVKDPANIDKIYPKSAPNATSNFTKVSDFDKISVCTSWKDYFKFTKVNTVFTFEIDPENTFFCTSGGVDQNLSLEISYSAIPYNQTTGAMLSPVTGSFTLRLVFNPITGKLETKKTTKILENYLKVTYNYKFKVDGVDYTSQCAPSVVFFVETQADRNYKMYSDFNNFHNARTISVEYNNVESCVNKNTLSINDAKATSTICNDVNYFSHDIPEFYELEYAFVDFYAPRDNPNTINEQAYANFKNNSTRVQLKSNTFDIPCIYPKGFIIYRCRKVAYDIFNPNKLIYSQWSAPDEVYPQVIMFRFNYDYNLEEVSPSGLTHEGAGPKMGFMIKGHELSKNWQYSIAFAEDAKNKGVISYFDGSLRNRQTITRMNADNSTIVGQTIYDWYGRPAISVLPVPADPNTQNNYCFKSNFNISTVTDKQYNWKDFDTDVDAENCHWKAANPMKNTMGASKYYSSNNSSINISVSNPVVDEKSLFIPNALEYPFAQTEFTPDATNRPRRQGGLGQTHQLSGYLTGGGAQVGKYTGFAYEVPTQEELFLLFGNDIGNHEYYRKNITTDPNGQNSVTYIDPDGKTIATALMGDPNNSASLEALNSSNDFLDISTQFPSRRLSKKGIYDDRLESRSTKYFSESQTMYISYEFTPETYANQCNNNVCLDCIYDLKIEVINQCGGVIEIVNLPKVNLSEFNLTCQGPTQYRLNNFNPVPVSVEEGTYTIIKTLTVNREAFEFYKDAYMNDPNCIETLDDFIDEEIEKIDYTDCFRDCEVCEADVQQIQNEINALTQQVLTLQIEPITIPEQEQIEELNIQIAEKLADKLEMQEECKTICGDLTECDLLLEQIKLDMMPGGDYAQYLKADKLADGLTEELASGDEGYIYKLTAGPGSAKYQNPKNTSGTATPYKNKDGSDAYTVVECIGVGSFSPPVFGTIYNLSKVALANPSDAILGEKYLVKPNQLSNYKDFINIFESHWVEQLIHYHPELCMYTQCKNIDASYKYDMEMMNTNDPEEAIDKGYLNPLNTSSQGYQCDKNGVRSSVLLNFPAAISPYTLDPFAGYTSSPALLSYLNTELNNYKDHYGVNTGYTIWELYYIYLENLNPNLANNTCFNGEGWEYFRTLYINAKRNALAQYYYDHDGTNPNLTWCAANIDGILGANPSIKRKFLYRKSDKTNTVPNSTHTNYNTDFDVELVAKCHDNCMLNVDVWMEKLEGCNLSPADEILMRDALLSVCERSCDAENFLGGQKVLKANRSATLPNTTREAILKVRGYIAAYVCDDILLDFPTTYDEDVNAYLSPYADTCACNTYATEPVKRLGCTPETVEPGPPPTNEQIALNEKLNECICPIENPALRNDLLVREDIPENKKCKNCIDCDQMAIGLYRFFVYIIPNQKNSQSGGDPYIIQETAVDNFMALDYTLPENQKKMEDFFNKYFGFNLSYADYLEMSRKCLNDMELGDNSVWATYFAKARGIPDYRKLDSKDDVQYEYEDEVQLATCGCDKIFEAKKLANAGTYPTELIALKHLLGKSVNLNFLEFNDAYNLCCAAVAASNPGTTPSTMVPPPIATPNWFYTSSSLGCIPIDHRPGKWDYGQRMYFRNMLTLPPPLDPVLNKIITELSPCKDNYFTPCPQLCNKPRPFITEYTDPCIELLETFALLNAKHKYIKYLKDKEEEFERNYYAKCLQAEENLTFKFQLRQYHYTLYYYDQAGNLTKTVPPAGVDIQHWFDTKEIDAGAPSPQSLCDARIAACKTYKADVDNGGTLTAPYTVPSHRLITQYQYNTLNQLAWQKTPDAGESEFWYDRLGRLVVSRNSKQLANENYSYTVYNKLGLILEVGQINVPSSATQMDAHLAADPDLLKDFLSLQILFNKTQVTRTVYNKQYIPATEAKFSDGVQANLRNRVVSIFVLAERGSLLNPGQYQHAVHYSYDIHGNVKEMVQEVSELDRFGKRWSNITYQYDLISGNVNQVNYQPGKVDAYHHRYEYDGDNRLVNVETSKEGRVWETDARYQYYQHGPMARTELGQEQVQGMDYAYTLSGWLKAVNGDILKPDNDIGKDGTNLIPVQRHSYFARDIFGYTLGYYKSDYTAIGASNLLYKQMRIQHFNGGANTDMSSTTKELFNGNINNMTIALPDFATFANGTPFTAKPVANTYRYDQLNRITKARFFDETTVTPMGDLRWATNSKTGEDAYYSTYQYDANGNITKLTRKNSGNVLMDNLTYRYNYVDAANTGKGKFDNKLYHVNDAASTASTPEIKDQGAYSNPSTGNYQYDEIGNLIHDASEEIDEIEWNVYGKISKIIRRRTGTPSTKPDLEFVYDATGQRLIKKVKPWISGALAPSSKWVYTYYLRDAQGNAMAVYASGNDTTYRLTEHHIYGSSRLGMQTYRGTDNVTGKHLVKNNNLVQLTPPDSMIYTIRGLKQYELSNHLGNVQATVSDRKQVVVSTTFTTSIEYYLPDVQSMTDNYAFGMVMIGRTWSASVAYRYGMNTQEKDDEIFEGAYSAQYWEYDSRLGRRWNTDPVPQIGISDYACFLNNPIFYTDYNGDIPGVGLKFIPKEVWRAIGRNAWNWVRNKGYINRAYKTARKYNVDPSLIKWDHENRSASLEIVKSESGTFKSDDGYLNSGGYLEEHYFTFHFSSKVGQAEYYVYTNSSMSYAEVKEANRRAGTNAGIDKMSKWAANSVEIAIAGLNPSIGARSALVREIERQIEVNATKEGMTTVGRWMSKAEYEMMAKTGQMVEGAGGQTFVATGGPGAFNAAAKGSVYAEFQVPTNSLLQGGQANWFKVLGPNSGKAMQGALQKQGGQLLPQIKNLSPILQVK